MRNVLLSLAVALLSIAGRAQFYTFQQATAPYVPLIAPTSCTFDANGFDDLTELDGEVFQFFGQSYTAGSPYSMVIGDWGFLRVDGTTSAVIIDGLFTEIAAVDASSSVYYAITGTAGHRVLTAQWTNWHLAQGPADNYASFQITVDQATGVITIHTGPNSGGGLVFNDATGPNCGIFRANNAFTVCHAKLWVEVDPLAPTLDTQANFDFDALHGLPPEGTIYRLTPSATSGIIALERGPVSAFVIDGGIRIQLPEGSTARTMQLLDANGREVARAMAGGSASVMRTAGLGSGLYVLRPTDGSLASVRVWLP
ncbi:MAG TPA: hypothetical protein VHL57_06225 [Flavobacteriales bacterium]|jgi:hypothetical protein|nr:hypothetical protein [Flavobacteriales bacterium]